MRILLVLCAAVGIWKWRYVVYGPAWVVRSRFADKSDLYEGKRNNLGNLQIVQQARNYLSDLNRIDASGNLTSPEALRTQGIRISEKWFERHHPDSVEFNPFAPTTEGNYAVTWRYFPGCQETLRTSLKTRTDWFDRQGQPCSPACLLTVFMDPQLKLRTVKITPTLGG